MNEIDKYISGFPEETAKMLAQLRNTVRKAAPDAEEVISYGMPAYKQHGIVLYFAGHTNHIGFYPKTTAIEVFKSELTSYHTSKGTIQFPIGKPLPLNLIEKIVRFRVNENIEKKRNKNRKK